MNQESFLSKGKKVDIQISFVVVSNPIFDLANGGFSLLLFSYLFLFMFSNCRKYCLLVVGPTLSYLSLSLFYGFLAKLT